jgi:hypothetical protein
VPELFGSATLVVVSLGPDLAKYFNKPLPHTRRYRHIGAKLVELMATTTTRARAPSDWLIGELFSCTE